jgi:hypothetical protein
MVRMTAVVAGGGVLGGGVLSIPVGWAARQETLTILSPGARKARHATLK